MTTDLNSLSAEVGDAIFLGADNCFRRALSPTTGKEEGKSDVDWNKLFQNCSKNDIQSLLNRRKGEWKTLNTDTEGRSRVDAVVEGLCFATAGLIQGSAELIAEAIPCFEKLLPATTTITDDAEHTFELGKFRDMIAGTINGIDELLDQIEKSRSASAFAASVMIRDLSFQYVAESFVQGDDTHAVVMGKLEELQVGVCECPLAYARDSDNASIFRLVVRLWQSKYPIVTPDLFHGGALLWSATRHSEIKDLQPGWQSILAVWNRLQPWCPNVRVSLGIEPWDSGQEIPTPVLDGDSIQAAVALAIWSAYQKTPNARIDAWRTRVSELDERLLDFELDPTAIVTASLNLDHDSPIQWLLKWVRNVRSKFLAAGRTGLQMAITAHQKPVGAELELAGLTIPVDDADNFAELCEKMALFNLHRRNYDALCIAEWHKEFLTDEEAAALIAERSTADTADTADT